MDEDINFEKSNENSYLDKFDLNIPKKHKIIILIMSIILIFLILFLILLF